MTLETLAFQYIGFPLFESIQTIAGVITLPVFADARRIVASVFISLAFVNVLTLIGLLSVFSLALFILLLLLSTSIKQSRFYYK